MDNHEKVLLALYAEMIHGGTFADVTSTSMGMEKREFGWALYRLQMMGMIRGCVFQPPSPQSPGNVMGVLRRNLLLTEKGYSAAEAMMQEPENDAVRLHRVWGILRDIGCGVMASIIYSWL